MLRLKRTTHLAISELRETFSPRLILSILLGTAIVTFGVCNIHRQSTISEGGILGMILLLNHWLGLSPALLSPLLDAMSYALGFKHLGRRFLITSAAASASIAFFYWFWELFPPLLPSLADYPLLAAVSGGCFIGVGCGLVVRQGASCAGDDALALVISKLTGWRIARAYLFTDLTVLLLSLSYISPGRIVYSLITVTISSSLIDFIQNFSFEQGMAGQGELD